MINMPSYLKLQDTLLVEYWITRRLWQPSLLPQQIQIEDHVDADIFKMSDAEREKHKIGQLPASLRESIEELKSDSDFLKPVFGKHVIERIIEDAAKQHMELAVRPHPHEFTMYADV